MNDDNLWYEPVRERLALRRKQMGLTQRDAGALVGLDAGTWCHLETGRKNGRPYQPGPRVVARMALALRVDVSLILTLDAAEWPEPFVVDVLDSLRF